MQSSTFFHRFNHPTARVNAPTTSLSRNHFFTTFAVWRGTKSCWNSIQSSEIFMWCFTFSSRSWRPLTCNHFLISSKDDQSCPSVGYLLYRRRTLLVPAFFAKSDPFLSLFFTQQLLLGQSSINQTQITWQASSNCALIDITSISADLRRACMRFSGQRAQVFVFRPQFSLLFIRGQLCNYKISRNMQSFCKSTLRISFSNKDLDFSSHEIAVLPHLTHDTSQIRNVEAQFFCANDWLKSERPTAAWMYKATS